MQLKILVDEGVDFKIVRELRKKGFEVISVVEDFKGASDGKVLDIAMGKRALLLTEDKDFGEWVFAHKAETIGVIFLRYKSSEIAEISDALQNLLLKYKDSLYKKFAVIKANKVRIRDLP